MNLTLKIVNNPKEAINSQSYEFKKEGGTIGRGSDCSWVLNDRSTTLSSVHAEISYKKGGNYYLIDLSTNGIAYKRENRLVPPGELVLLRESEVLSMGPYDILVGFVKSSNNNDVLSNLLNQREIDVAIEENLLLKKEGNPALEVIMKSKVEEKSILEFANALTKEEIFIGDDAFDDGADADIYSTHINPPSFEEEPKEETRILGESSDGILMGVLATKLGINLKNMSQEQQIVVVSDLADGILTALEESEAIEKNVHLIEKNLEKPNVKLEKPKIKGAKATLNSMLSGSNERIALGIKQRLQKARLQHTALYEATVQQSEALQKEFSPNVLVSELYVNSLFNLFSKDALIWRAYMRKYAYLNKGCSSSERCFSKELFNKYKREKERLELAE